jgi:tRNA pseudouridine55 synthase
LRERDRLLTSQRKTRQTATRLRLLMIGAFIIDKPEGMTSHDVVDRVRRILGTRRVGHTGTLDPFATGVLVVCIGRATRLAQFLVHFDKEYEARIRLGFATDTQDRTGKQITPLAASNAVSIDDVIRVLNEFTGPQLQTPPMFSAKKVAGERLYQAARAGREVEREPVPVIVRSVELMGTLRDGPDGTRDFDVRVKCSSGTYVRTLAHDIGHRLGVGAHLSELRRIAVGHFILANALTLEALETKREQERLAIAMMAPAEMLAHLPGVRLGPEDVELIRHGRPVGVSMEDSGQDVRICDQEGCLIAVGYYEAAGRLLRPRIVMADGG